MSMLTKWTDPSAFNDELSVKDHEQTNGRVLREMDVAGD